MKNVVSMAILAIALGSCSKEPVDLSNNSGQNSLSSGTVGVDAPGPPKPVKLRVFYDNGGIDYGCKTGRGNCGPDIIVTPGNDGFKSVFEAIATNDPVVIQNAFRNQKPFLKNYITEDVIDKAINGAYSVSVKNNDAIKTRFIIFTAANSKVIEMVYPIVTQ